MRHETVANWSKSALINTDTRFYILTRYNLRWPGFYEEESEFQAWSKQRLKLFQEVCVPGVKSQMVLPHAWYVLFDETFKEREEDLHKMVGLDIFRPIFTPRNLKSGKAMQWFIEHNLKSDMRDAEYVVGARLDNDDTISRYFISFLDDCLAYARTIKPAPLAFNFPYQFAIIDRRAHVYVATDSSTTALWERAAGARTPYAAMHTKMWEKFDVIECATTIPMVAMHLHDNNAGRLGRDNLIAVDNGEQVAAKFFAFDFPPR